MENMQSWLWQGGDSSPWLLSILPLLLLLMILMTSCIIFFSSYKLPPGPPALPIIGHLHLLTDFSHLTLAHLSNQYGPLVFLRLGSMPAVIASSSTMAREFLLTHDTIFASRPRAEFNERAGYGRDHAVIFAQYGARWKELRRICALELFSAKRLQKLEHVRTEEIQLMLLDIQKQSQGGKLPINLGKCLGAFASDVIGRMLLSDRISQRGGDSLKEMLREISAIFATPVIGDCIPYLGWLDVKAKRTMNGFHDRIDRIMDGLLSEREQKRATNPTDVSSDFLDVLVSKIEEGLDRKTIKGVLMDLLSAGIDTPSNTMEWAMAELLKNPACLRKLQDELDTLVQSPGDLVDESDACNLPYLNSVVKETFRLHPPAPFLLPHASTEACTVAGYTLPKHTRVFVNVWAIGRDPNIWENPLQFCPDRFKDNDMDVRGQHFELLPFGSGRRSCPGIGLGLMVLNSIVANLVRSFDWELPNEMSAMELDMRERKGITLSKATPLFAIPKPRLHVSSKNSLRSV